LKLLEKLNPWNRPRAQAAKAKADQLGQTAEEIRARIEELRLDCATLNSQIDENDALKELGEPVDAKAARATRSRRDEVVTEIARLSARLSALERAERIQAERRNATEQAEREGVIADAKAETIRLLDEALPHVISLAAIAQESAAIVETARSLGAQKIAAVALPAFWFSLPGPAGEKQYTLDPQGVTALRQHVERASERLSASVQAADTALRKLTNARPQITERLRALSTDLHATEKALRENVDQDGRVHDIQLQERLIEQKLRTEDRIERERQALKGYSAHQN